MQSKNDEVVIHQASLFSTAVSSTNNLLTVISLFKNIENLCTVVSDQKCLEEDLEYIFTAAEVANKMPSLNKKLKHFVDKTSGQYNHVYLYPGSTVELSEESLAGHGMEVRKETISYMKASNMLIQLGRGHGKALILMGADILNTNAGAAEHPKITKKDIIDDDPDDSPEDSIDEFFNTTLIKQQLEAKIDELTKELTLAQSTIQELKSENKILKATQWTN